MQNPRDPNREPVDRERYAPGEERREPAGREPVGREPVGREPYAGERHEARYTEPRYTERPYAGTTRAFALSDLVRWGPILAGFAATMGVLILMGVLGAAIGIGIGPNAGTFGAIWGAIGLIVAFFVGGWIAARTSAVGGPMPAIINSSIVWAFTLLFILFLAALGVVGVAGVALDGLLAMEAPGVGVAGAAAWWTFIALILGLASAIVGGLVGMHPEAETVER